MDEELTTQQFIGERFRFFFPFIFTIPTVGFFIVHFPRHHRYPGFEQDSPMVVRRISETEFMFLRRIGFHECPVMMEHGF